MQRAHDLPQVLRIPMALGVVFAVVGFASCSSESPGSRVPPPGGSAGASGASGGASGGVGVGGVSGNGVGAISFGGASSGVSGSGSRIEDGAACAGDVVEGARTPSIVLFVIDRSGSMTCNPPPLQDSAKCESRPEPADPNQPSKWSVVSTAIKQAIAGLPSNATVGVTFFNKDDLCGVEAAAGLGTYSPDVALRTLDTAQLDAIHASIDGVKPKGETPIVDASYAGYEILRLATMPGSKFLVLLTDGVDTCTVDPKVKSDFLAFTVPRAFQGGIRSFVIGAPGSEGGRGFLSLMAYNGGTATNASCDRSNVQPTVGNCHFDMSQTADFAAALNSALDQIAAAAVSCELNMPTVEGGALDVTKVNVDVTSPSGVEPLYQDNSAACNAGADGWQYNADKTKIILCGNACAKYKARGASVSIQLGCRGRIR